MLDIRFEIPKKTSVFFGNIFLKKRYKYTKIFQLLFFVQNICFILLKYWKTTLLFSLKRCLCHVRQELYKLYEPYKLSTNKNGRFFWGKTQDENVWALCWEASESMAGTRLSHQACKGGNNEETCLGKWTLFV